MPEIWTDFSGKKYEMKHDAGGEWYRAQGESEDKWKKGYPPGWIEKARHLSDQR